MCFIFFHSSANVLYPIDICISTTCMQYELVHYLQTCLTRSKQEYLQSTIYVNIRAKIFRRCQQSSSLILHTKLPLGASVLSPSSFLEGQTQKTLNCVLCKITIMISTKIRSFCVSCDTAYICYLQQVLVNRSIPDIWRIMKWDRTAYCLTR